MAPSILDGVPTYPRFQAFEDPSFQFPGILQAKQCLSSPIQSTKAAESYYPDLRSRHNFILICWAIGTAAAVVVLTISYLTGHLHS
jgi:hypothetical protein